MFHISRFIIPISLDISRSEELFQPCKKTKYTECSTMQPKNPESQKYTYPHYIPALLLPLPLALAPAVPLASTYGACVSIMAATEAVASAPALTNSTFCGAVTIGTCSGGFKISHMTVL
jgi:hypothetical protein